MERSRVAFTVLLCVLVFSQTNGEEVEMKVRPGDNTTLYCDRSLTYGSLIVWIRNCSHINQPSLIIGFKQWGLETYQHFSFIHNLYNNSYDLHITNISVSDLGLYYCVEEQNTLHEDEQGILYSSKVYYKGNRTIRLSLDESPSAPPDCVLCWTLLFSVCPVCFLLSSLLSSICVFCFCRAQTTGGFYGESSV